MTEPHDLREARRLLQGARRVAVLTGAGVSAESGLHTFRGEGGIWKSYRAEDLATPEGFARDPRLVWEWYNMRRGKVASAEPNAGHRALAALEGRVPEFLLATQNVDGLHALAGSRRMVELHGSLWRVRCTGCGAVRDDRRVILPVPPACEACGALLRPDVVWFGEPLDPAVIGRAAEAARVCDVFLVVGTSAIVQPAASLAWEAKRAGAAVVEVNPTETPLSEVCDLAFRSRSGDLLPLLVAEP